MARTPFTGVLMLFLVAVQIVPVSHPRGQVPGTAGHEHLTEVACVDVPPVAKPALPVRFLVSFARRVHRTPDGIRWTPQRDRSPPSGR